MPYRLVQSIVIFISIYVLPVMRLTRNWWDVGFVYMGLSGSKEIRMKDGKTVLLEKGSTNKLVSELRALAIPDEMKRRLDVRIGNGYATMKVGGKTLKVGLESLFSVATEFYTTPHREVDVKGRITVDVGAYLGETALYYLIAGKAKKVYAYEPVPFLYEKARENIELNNLEDKIVVINKAVGGKNGFMKISGVESSFAKRDLSRNKLKEVRIGIVSLDSLVEEFNISHGVLKVDTEGAEYETFRMASSKAIKAFDKMHIEYHYGYSDLVERLKNEGFEVTCSRPFYSFKGFSSKPMLNGDLIALKKSLKP